MDTFKVGVMTLAWTFIVIVMYMIANTMLFGHVTPIMDDIANQSRTENGGFVDYDNYVARTTMIKNGVNIAFFILLLIPYAYIFVRLLLKKEQTTTPYYNPMGGSW